MNASIQHPTLSPKTKLLVVVVALGVIVGQVLTFFGGLANKHGWDVIQLPCECAWMVLAFPLGWLGLFARGLLPIPQAMLYADLFLWTGATLNGLFWAWMVYRLVKSLRFSGTHTAFDATALSPCLTDLRQSHVVAAHARSPLPYARKGLLAIATRAVRHCAYFLNRSGDSADRRTLRFEAQKLSSVGTAALSRAAAATDRTPPVRSGDKPIVKD